MKSRVGAQTHRRGLSRGRGWKRTGVDGRQAPAGRHPTPTPRPQRSRGERQQREAALSAVRRELEQSRLAVRRLYVQGALGTSPVRLC